MADVRLVRDRATVRGELAKVVLGSWWVPTRTGPSRPSANVARQVLGERLVDGQRQVRLSNAKGGGTWIRAKALVYSYRAVEGKRHLPPKSAAEQVNGAGDYLRKIVREEIRAALLAYEAQAGAAGAARERDARALVRTECLAAIREAFGESGAPS